VWVAVIINAILDLARRDIDDQLAELNGSRGRGRRLVAMRLVCHAPRVAQTVVNPLCEL
jgi:hypothetical protein